MGIFRNKEVLKDFFLHISISVVFTFLAWCFNSDCGFATLFVCIVFTLVHFISTYRRYKRISDMAMDINKILHGADKIHFDKYSEGELAVLQSEIYKMTVRLREQKQNLINDKTYLADSLADISHQIRTPLTSINLLVQFLSEPDITDERKQKLIRELYELLSRIDWLITSLLKLSKLDAGVVRFNNETVSLKELIDKSCAPVAIAAELRGQIIDINAKGNFSGDISWTAEALGNIVKNCMEHSPDGGKIEITAKENPLFTEIVIRDNGSGMEKEDLPHIFERFYKGKNSGDKSFGIGLALSRMIITGQKGTVKAENADPVGAIFTVRFYKGII